METNNFYVARDLLSHPTRYTYATDEDTEIWSN